MLFWNRVELYNGFSLKEFSDLRDALVAADIKYGYKLVDRNKSWLSGNSGRKINNLTQDPKFTVQYYLYVHHKNYDHAMFLTSNRHVSKII